MGTAKRKTTAGKRGFEEVKTEKIQLEGFGVSGVGLQLEGYCCGGGSRHHLRTHGFTIDMQLPDAITKRGNNCPSAPPGSDLEVSEDLDDTLTWENSRELKDDQEYGVAVLSKKPGEEEKKDIKIYTTDSWKVIPEAKVSRIGDTKKFKADL